MERITYKEKRWEHNVERDAAEGPVVRVSRDEVELAIKDMKTGKSSSPPSDISLKLIAASEEVGTQMMLELCQRALDGFRMQGEWAQSTVVAIFKRKNNIRNSSFYRAMRIPEHICRR